MERRQNHCTHSPREMTRRVPQMLLMNHPFLLGSGLCTGVLIADICNDLPDIFTSTELRTRSAIHPGSAGKALENTQPVVSGDLVDKCTCLLTHLPEGPTLPPPSPHRTELQSPTLVNRLVLLSSLPLLTRPADFPGIFSKVIA